MERRDFLGWMGKLSLAIGMGSLIGNAGELPDMTTQQILPDRCGDYRRRMNGRACHDFRLISNDRSMCLDREIFYS
jgi:hypothetical protein